MKNLSDPIVIEFQITNKSYAHNCSCAFWDFDANNKLGGWSTNGCVYEIIGNGRSRCNCSHLTHFGILLVSIMTNLYLVHITSSTAHHF